jgi:hypothetical protein
VLSATRVLDEQLLRETIRFFDVLVVMALADVTNVRELLDAELAAAFAESLERVFGLPRHHDVTHEAEEIALPGGVGEILCHSDSTAGRSLQCTADVLERIAVPTAFGIAECVLKLLQHSLMLTHARNMARAEIAKALILRLRLVIDNGP